ncbi:APC membrane recruitment protein 3-like [Hoplias malabaricus]|uniref:APC membrane recruitment protein 3-like n=1 Tax=Hoplias malabaricus TaxID=27720 RepID=UPI0034632020
MLRENQNPSGHSREIIDYRNLTPQVPFVPSIAKSIPKKRIFLRKPKKAIKDFFVPKKHSSEKTTSPCAQSGRRTTSKPNKKPLRRRKTSRESNTTLSDSSSECGDNVCEDAVSLKSFGSQAGCGEIFVDEEYLVSLEGSLKLETAHKMSDTPRRSPSATALQGGKEQLASPAQPEVLDLFGMWETFNRTIFTMSTPVSVSPSTNKRSDLQECPLIPEKGSEAKVSELTASIDTPKSENQESTSDEGYCDYVSNEDHTRSSLTPVHSKKFPRDTYSGDALYELFYDPSEADMTPIFDDEMDLTHSIIGQSSDLPLSMYSFHVGAEENLAPPLAVDFISHELLQSNWAGRDCLLKLCDTEISLAMGIVNWLKQKAVKGSPELSPPINSSGDSGYPCLGDKSQTTKTGNIQRVSVLQTENSQEDINNFKSSDISQLDAGHLALDPQKHNALVSTVTTPESQPRTPTSHVCFRIFNINSPLTPTRDLQSPVAHSPGSGTGSLFVLAINKESLCDSCKASLKHGAKELHLCHSCTSFIEQIKTSEHWAHASLTQSRPAGTPQTLKGGLLPSPSSSCGVASDISILSLVEQCASQVSSLKINKHQNLSDCGRKDSAQPGKDTQPKKDHSRKYLKHKHKKKMKAAAVGLDVSYYANGRNGASHHIHSPSVLEAEGLGLVTSNESDDLFLETYKSPCCSQSNSLSDTTSRPTSLPLSGANCSEISRKERHKIKERQHEKSQRHKKSVVNRHGPSDNVFLVEKVEQKCRKQK